jgi:hypothetical protein
LKLSDLELIQTILENKELPQLFSKNNSENEEDNYLLVLDKIDTLEDIFNLNLELKKKGTFFTEKYITPYAFDIEIAEKEFELLIKTNKKIMIYEILFFEFNGLIPLHLKTIDTLFDKNEGFIQISWRYYIAIMVNKIY